MYVTSSGLHKALLHRTPPQPPADPVPEPDQAGSVASFGTESDEDFSLLGSHLRRQVTDSVVEAQSRSLRAELERRIAEVLKSRNCAEARSALEASSASYHGAAFGGSLLSSASDMTAESGLVSGGFGCSHGGADLNNSMAGILSPPPGLGVVSSWSLPGARPATKQELMDAWPMSTYMRRTSSPEPGPELDPVPKVVEAAKVQYDVTDTQQDVEINPGGMQHDSQDIDDDDQDDAQPAKSLPPWLLAAREKAASGEGLSGCTTVMIQHIPSKCSQRKLMREINSAGFLGRYDFFYLPIDPRSRMNRGFAFVNFTNPEAAEAFYRKFNNQRFKQLPSEEALAIMPADLQGYEQNAAKYAASRLSAKRAPHSRPVFFQPLPGHTGKDGNLRRINPLAPESLEPGAVATITTERKQSKQVLANEVSKKSLLRKEGAAPAPMATTPRSSTQRFPSVASTAPSSSGMETGVPGVAMAGPMELLSQSQAPLVPRFCAFCGHPRTSVHMFCPYCGVRFHAPLA